MNKAQLVTAMAEQAGITKVDAKKALDAFIKVTGKALAEGDKLSLVGFGSFSVAKKPARMGRNPRTGAAIKIAPKHVAKFRPGAELHAKIRK
ncbi:MAG: HU family DNA-binding protein [Rikenellaceae bacterium]|nr:HU family DNA-binding protein [Rikenellaceae bacterium]MCL2693338.1 HU family DNA-binding protein [Rikenellaceae bacterium]